MNDTREHRDNLKEQIIENFRTHYKLDIIDTEIQMYVEDDHVDEIGQAGFYSLKGIDWDELKKQKATLVNVIHETNDVLTANHLSGILHQIDSIQDYAVDVVGLPEDKVFLFEDEEPDHISIVDGIVDGIYEGDLFWVEKDEKIDNLNLDQVKKDVKIYVQRNGLNSLKSDGDHIEIYDHATELLERNYKIALIENIQSTLDLLQNRSHEVLKQELYNQMYTLRCDIQSQLDDLKEN